MNVALPSVSIGMPVFNGAPLLRQAMDSLLAQECANFELIISDNASTDETADICREYAARDPRVSYSRLDVNCGAVANFNRVFELARGEFFMWAAHDDVWHPRFLHHCLGALQAHPEAVVCHSYGQPFLQSGQEIGKPHVGWVNERPTAYERWHVVMRDWRLHSAIHGLMRRSIVARTRLLQVSLSADLIFIAEMGLHGTIIQVPEVLHWKRAPNPEQAYRTPTAMLAYLGHRRPSPRLLRLMVSRQLIRGLRHAGLEPRLARRMAWDTAIAYISQKYWLIDLKEFMAGLRAPRWHESL